MKHFADISSDTPFSIELKAPPMDTFHNKGTGTLILKDGAYSDGDVRVTADGPVICGPITCRDLYIFRHVRQKFPCRPAVHVPRHDTTYKSKCFHRPDRWYHLPPPECASRRGKQHQRQGDNGYRRCGTILFLRNPSPSRAVAQRPHWPMRRAEASKPKGCKPMDATATVTGEGTVSCHATRKIEGEVNGTGSISYKGRPRIVCKTPSGRDHINPIK